MQGLDQVSTIMTNLAYALVFLALGFCGLLALGYAFLLWIRNRNREEYSLSFVTLEVAKMMNGIAFYCRSMRFRLRS